MISSFGGKIQFFSFGLAEKYDFGLVEKNMIFGFARKIQFFWFWLFSVLAGKHNFGFTGKSNFLILVKNVIFGFGMISSFIEKSQFWISQKKTCFFNFGKNMIYDFDRKTLF